MKLYYWTDKDGKMLNETCSLSETSDASQFIARERCDRSLVKFYLAEWVFDRVEAGFIDSFRRMARSHGFERKEIELTTDTQEK